MARTIRGNATRVTVVVNYPDEFSRQIASLGLVTNTFSPASAGVDPGQSQPRTRGFFRGLSGVGVNRAAGRTNPQQFFIGAARAIKPVSDPSNRRVGFGTGTSGQPGWPGTNVDAPDGSPLGPLTAFQLGGGYAP